MQFKKASRSHTHLPRATALVVAALMSGAPAFAEVSTTDDSPALIAQLQQQIREQEARLAKLEDLLAQTPQSRPGTSPVIQPAAPIGFVSGDRVSESPASPPSRFKITGDMRLRYEHNSSDGEGRSDSRGVVRGRVAATYAASPGLELGARLVTGDPDDPNSADVSLSNFNDDLQVSLDQIYGKKVFGPLTLVGGKFANPFRRTDLVWDGDVNPQGLAAQYVAVDTGATRIGASALLFPIERSVAAADSTASGVQVTVDQQIGSAWKLGLAAGYYDYEIEATGTANSGDTRTNRLDSTGAYVSDFDLLDLIATASYSGFGNRWPLRFQADVVQNLGADAYDTGYSLSASVGQTASAGDYSFGYGYHQAEADAVFAAFAQDNIAYGSNYLQHALSASYAISDHLELDTTLYAYRIKDTALIPLATDDWQQRLRINLVAHF